MNVADTSRPGPCSGPVTELDICDERYPPLLRAIPHPPPQLYVRGDPACLRQPQLAVVGARRASPVALRIAQELSARAVAAGLGICSGLARGIDGAAHQGAIAAGGCSVAVMATGIDQVYPSRHRQLAVDLLRDGCLVTEFPPGAPPRKAHFPQRNRIISGLSLGVLVVEAALPSGSLITAGTALEQGREVFALPWSIAHPGGAGCLKLLRDGAKMVCTIDDIVEEFAVQHALQPGTGQACEPAAALQPDSGGELLALVGCEAASLDELISASGLPTGEVLAGLSRLETRGLICRCPGGYIRCQ